MKSKLITALISGAIAVGSIATAHAQQSNTAVGRQTETTKDRLVGTWQIVSFKTTTGDKVSYPLGEQPGGFIGITTSRIWIMLVDSTRKTPATTALTDAEAVALMKTSISYTAKYDLDPVQTEDGIKMIQHVDASSNQSLTGTDRVFFIRVDGDKLFLRSPSIVVPNTGLKSSVQAEYARAD